MEMDKINVGDQFYTKGDWQTEPGFWEVTSLDTHTPLSVQAKPITNSWEDESFWSLDYVRRNKTDS